MVPTTPMQFLPDQDVTPVRALSSLTRRDAAAVRATVRATGGAFTVEEHDDYDGYLFLMLTPVQDGRSAFLVSGRTGAVDLAELRGDDMIPLGTGFASIGAGMLVLRSVLQGSKTARQASRVTVDHPAHGAETPAGWIEILQAIDGLDRRR